MGSRRYPLPITTLKYLCLPRSDLIFMASHPLAIPFLPIIPYALHPRVFCVAQLSTLLSRTDWILFSPPPSFFSPASPVSTGPCSLFWSSTEFPPEHLVQAQRQNRPFSFNVHYCGGDCSETQVEFPFTLSYWSSPHSLLLSELQWVKSTPRSVAYTYFYVTTETNQIRNFFEPNNRFFLLEYSQFFWEGCRKPLGCYCQFGG